MQIDGFLSPMGGLDNEVCHLGEVLCESQWSPLGFIRTVSWTTAGRPSFTLRFLVGGRGPLVPFQIQQPIIAAQGHPGGTVGTVG